MPVPEETVSDSLLEKFENLSCNPSLYDRMIKRVTVIKKPNIRKNNITTNTSTKDMKHKEDNFVASLGRYFNNLGENQSSHNQNKLSCSAEKDQYTLGISIVQGSDRNVYVKDIVENGPSDEAGVKIGDQVRLLLNYPHLLLNSYLFQILAVNGISLLSLPYEKCIEILQKTPHTCELVISQLVSVTKESRTGMDKRNSYVLSPIIAANNATLSPYRYFSSSNNNLLTLSQQKFKSNSVSNITERTSNVLFQITSTPNTSENRENKLRELENNIIARDSPIQLHEADEVASVNEQKYIGGEIDLDTVMHLKKMGSLKNFDKYQLGSPSKSMPDIPKVCNPFLFLSSSSLFIKQSLFPL